MIGQALAAVTGETGEAVGRLPRVLDPACGEGAFLLPAFDRLADAAGGSRPLSVDRRIEIVHDSIFGVDLDDRAVERLRSELLARIGGTGTKRDRAQKVIAANIRIGDALTGVGFAADDSAAGRPPKRPRGGPKAKSLCWTRAFPAIASGGGFDLVIGNPPYVRERDAQRLFAELAATPLGRRWSQARMDLWHYFVHRGLDLLRPRGVLAFVVNSYWTASKGAGKLISRLRDETRFEQIELLGNEPLFAGVSGRHMVFRIRKLAGTHHQTPDAFGRPEPGCRIVTPGGHPVVNSVAHAQLFQNGRIVLGPPDRLQRYRVATTPLGASFETRQGMAENPPAIGARHLREFGNRFTIGEGVFVLDDSQLDRLELSARERQLLRPYFDTAALGRYHLPQRGTQQVLYLTKATAPSLVGLPNIARHLARFRPILDRRRETRLGKSPWWHLHWPRDETIFTQPRVVSIQMGRRPQFVFATGPTYVGFSINLILATEKSAHSLPGLTGILNSQLAAEWFERHAKRRGVNLDINACVLRDFPLPPPDAALDARIASLVTQRHESPADSRQAIQLERKIEALLTGWYRASEVARST